MWQAGLGEVSHTPAATKMCPATASIGDAFLKPSLTSVKVGTVLLELGPGIGLGSQMVLDIYWIQG